MSKMIKFLTLTGIVLFSALALTGCDILSGVSKDDLLGKIDEDIAWANAAPVTVAVAFPSSWGRSPQEGTNRCADLLGRGAPRVGYPFDIDFTPESEFALLEWRAYALADLEDGWNDDLDYFIRGGYMPNQIDKSKVSLPIASKNGNGGTGRFIIYTAEPVVLIPYCKDQPRIIRSQPSETARYYRRSGDLTFTFADPIAIDGSTDHGDGTFSIPFGTNTVSIECELLEYDEGDEYQFKLDGTDGKDSYYQTAIYNSSTRTITIRPNNFQPAPTDDLDDPDIIKKLEHNGPPVNSIVTLTLGTGIKTVRGTSWVFPIVPPVYTWITRATDCYVDYWEAEYSGGKVHLSWELKGVGTATVRYKEGAAAEYKSLSPEPGKPTECVISDAAPSPGMGYQILIDLISEGERILFETNHSPILIWKIEGMKVNVDKPARAIKLPADFAGMAVNNPDCIYVLDANISLPNPTCVGTDASAPFRGTFYGLGNTITIPGGAAFAAGANMGLFGYTAGATIRDLTVSYSGTATANNGGAANIGGIIGYAAGNTILKNVRVQGAGALQNTSSGTGEVNMGGIVGVAQGQVVIENSSTGINVSLNKNGNSGNVYIGGLAGKFSGSAISSNESQFSGTITVTGNVTLENATGSDIYIAGILGRKDNVGKLSGLKYAGTVTVTNSSGTWQNVAGILGGRQVPNLTDCVFTGTINVTNSSRSPTNLIAGGITAYMAGDTGFNQETKISYSAGVTTGGTIAVNSGGNIYAGGIAGYLSGSNSANRITLSGCTYEGAGADPIKITPINGSTGVVYAGGIVGSAETYLTFEDCHFKAPKIEVTKTNVNYSGELDIGGFAGRFNGGTINVSECSVEGAVSSTNGTGTTYAGGFAGLSYAALTECFAKGGAITSTGSGTVYSGGLIGYSAGPVSLSYASGDVTASNSGGTYLLAGGLIGNVDNSRAERSWASGKVIANRTGGASSTLGAVSAGGLVGYLGYKNANGVIANCYALGDVEVNGNASASVNLAAGGLVGYIYGANVDRSFATGSVKVRNHYLGDRGAAGGIVGDIYSWGEYKTSNTVALGKSVTVVSQAYSTPVYRIGYREVQTYENNRARVSLATGFSNSIGSTPGESTLSSTDSAGNDGTDVLVSETKSEAFWTSTMGFDTASIWEWNSSAASGGYPLLRGIDNNTPAEVEIEGFAITPNITPAGSGTIKLSENTVTTGGPKGEPKSIITFTPSANDGYNFTWPTTLPITGGSASRTGAGTEADPYKYTFTMPNNAVTINVTFSYVDYTVNRNPENGTVTGGTFTVSPSPAHINDTVTITANPIVAEGYLVEGFKVYETANPANVVFSSLNDTNAAGQLTRTFTMPAHNVTAEVTFIVKKQQLTLNAPTGGGASTYSVTAGGIVTPAPATSSTIISGVNVGSAVQINLTLMPEYRITRVRVRGDGIGGTDVLDYNPPPNNGPFGFTMPDFPVTVSVTFEHITYSAGPTGQQGQNNSTVGGTWQLSSTGNSGRALGALWSGDTVTITTSPRTQGQSRFEVDTITVTPVSGTVLTIGSGVTAVTPNSSYTFAMPSSNVIVAVTFRHISIDITRENNGVATTGGGTFTISANTASPSTNTNVTITATPADGWEVDQMRWHNESWNGTTWTPFVGSGNPRTVTVNSPTDVTIDVTFKKIVHTLIPAAGGAATSVEGGTFTLAVSGTGRAEVGETVTVTPVPAAGWGLDKMTYSSAGISPDPTITGNSFAVPALTSAATITVNVFFKKIVHTLIPTAGTSTPGTPAGSGTFTLSVSGTGRAEVGETVTVSPAPTDATWELDTITYSYPGISPGPMTIPGTGFGVPALTSATTITVTVTFKAVTPPGP